MPGRGVYPCSFSLQERAELEAKEEAARVKKALQDKARAQLLAEENEKLASKKAK